MPAPKTPLAKHEFDAWRADYDSRIENVVAFSGQPHDFYLRVKAEHLLETVRGKLLAKNCKVKVLDVGCGHGLSHTHFLTHSDVKVDLTGVDPAASVIAEAKKLNPGVSYAAYDGKQLPFKDGSFNISTATCVMHHVPPELWPTFLSEMRRVTKPGGLVMIYEHNPFNPATQYIVNTCPIDVDAVLLRNGKLRRLMRSAGLTNLRTDYLLFAPFDTPLFRKLDKALRWLPLGAQYALYGVNPI